MIDAELPDDPDDDLDDDISIVRPYSRTQGRTRSAYDLPIEALVVTATRGRDSWGLLDAEHQPIADLCQQVRSVAEVAALLRMPLGVARILLADMTGLGLIEVRTSTSPGRPDMPLLERVLAGLRRL